MICAWLALAAPAAAECRQALALGLDVSGSVDAAEYRMQLDGLAGALSGPEVRAALLDPGLPPVSVAVFEWSGGSAQRLVVDWTVIDTDAALERVAARLAGTTRALTDTKTGLGPALAYGGALLDGARACTYRTLDISGDGEANHGPRPDMVTLAEDITVNGLVIRGAADSVEVYYRSMVIRGPGAFVEVAEGFADYEAAMTRKLIRELQALPMTERAPWTATPRRARALR